MIDSSDGPGPCRRSVCQSPRGAGRQQMAVCSAPCVVSLLPTPPFSSPSALVTRPPSPPPQAGLFVCCGRASGGCQPLHTWPGAWFPRPGPHLCAEPADPSRETPSPPAPAQLPGQRPGLPGQSGGVAWLQDLPSTSVVTAQFWGPLTWPALVPGPGHFGLSGTLTP